MLVSGSEIDANMSWAAFDSRSGNLYAIHEGPGPDDDVVSWWTIAWDMENIINMTRVQESIRSSKVSALQAGSHS